MVKDARIGKLVRQPVRNQQSVANSCNYGDSLMLHFMFSGAYAVSLRLPAEWLLASY